MESRAQGSRPRTQKKFEAKDSLFEDRHSRGQGQECSRPRPRTKDTSASALQKKKKKKKRSSQKFFKRSTKFKHFKKYWCPRAEDRPIFEDLRPRGQGLDLRGQGQGLQNVSSRTPPLIFDYPYPYIFFCKCHERNLIWNWYGSMENCLPFHSRKPPFHSILASSIFHTEISVPFHSIPRNDYWFFSFFPKN